MKITLFVHNMFYMYAEDFYKVWNNDVNKYYDEIGKMDTNDSDLNLVLSGDFEDVTLLIDGHAFVKLNGDWKLIEIK